MKINNIINMAKNIKHRPEIIIIRTNSTSDIFLYLLYDKVYSCYDTIHNIFSLPY